MAFKLYANDTIHMTLNQKLIVIALRDQLQYRCHLAKAVPSMLKGFDF